MNFSTINESALIAAATAVVGTEATNAIFSLYLVIDKAQLDAYELGKLDGSADAEAAADEAWDNGYDTGEADGLAESDGAYIQGVSDARRRPAVADQIVADIVAEQDQHAFNGEYDADNVQDSGDAQ
jgi:hypothetical protein